MNNARIASVLDEIADILEFQNANPFRVRAYRNGARIIRDLSEPASAIVQDSSRKLTEIQGIGADLSDKITTLVETGELPMHQQLIAEVPPTVMAILRVPGLGPKKGSQLVKELRITSLAELKEACEQQRVRALKGFGAKTEATILAGLELASKATERMKWATADLLATSLREHLAACRAIERVELAGSYRRGRDTVGDLDALVISTDVSQAMDQLASFAAVAEVLARGDTKMSVRLGNGLQVDLRVVPAESWGAALQYFTGSQAHNIVLRGMSKAKKLKINEYGVFSGDEQIAGATEEEVYAALNLPWFPPELREARREFEWAEQGALPNLVELTDICGDLHMHTTATDGKATLEEMVAAAKERGLKYIAITDHSKRVSMARGLDAARLRAQWKEIDAIREVTKGIEVLKGVEVDILEKGELDLDDGVLAEADWVVASIHYGQTQPRDQITRRIIGAIKNPFVSAIAHPTGRIINRRASYDVNLDEVFKAARDYGKLMELNANPNRLDLDDVACAAAKDFGIPIVIDTDAHSMLDLDNMRYGVLQARRAGLTKQDVANTRSWTQLKKLLRP